MTKKINRKKITGVHKGNNIKISNRIKVRNKMNKKIIRHRVIRDKEIKEMVDSLVETLSFASPTYYFDFMATLVHEFYHNMAGQENQAKFISLNIREYLFYLSPKGSIEFTIVEDRGLQKALKKGTWFGYFDKTGEELATALLETLKKATYGTEMYTNDPINAVKSLANLSKETHDRLDMKLQAKGNKLKKIVMTFNNPTPEMRLKTKLRVWDEGCDQNWIKKIEAELNEGIYTSAHELNAKLKMLADVLNGNEDIDKLKGPARAHAEVILSLIK